VGNDGGDANVHRPWWWSMMTTLADEAMMSLLL